MFLTIYVIGMVIKIKMSEMSSIFRHSFLESFQHNLFNFINFSSSSGHKTYTMALLNICICCSDYESYKENTHISQYRLLIKKNISYSFKKLVSSIQMNFCLPSLYFTKICIYRNLKKISR